MSRKAEKFVKDQGASPESLEYKQEVQNFKLEGFSKTGDNQWSVQGKFADIMEPDVVLKSIVGESKGSNVSATITAERGTYNKDTRSAELKGNVVVLMNDGGKAYMDHAQWNANDEEITTDSPVRIIHSGVTLEGVGALVRPQKEWALVTTSIKLTDTKGRVITCDGPLEVDYKARKAILNKNVKIVDAQGTMYADQVIAYFNAEKKEIDRIEWIGNVKAVY
ncbi:MAG: LPS export ABC transporter periplasmic protein LptC [Candidatus Omnitrophica bacterium]|nr:LPS export ABC transporter periplasmic protein LptC [Candidatus Omnitrophota bacterium]